MQQKRRESFHGSRERKEGGAERGRKRGVEL